MANGYFVIQNGLQVGSLTIHAANADITSLGNVTSTSTTSLQAPSGNTAQRPATPATGMIRYNSDLSTFEGYGAGSQWGSLGGVKSVDGKAYIQAETSAGAGDDVLRFYSGSTGTSVQSMSVSGGNVSILPNTETTAPSTGALQVAGGASIAGNAYVANNLYIGSTAFAKNLTTPTIIAVDSGSTYAQLAMINTSGSGSSDFAAYADNGIDSAGWVDMGIAGSTFNDVNYTITKAQDGYLLTRPLSNSYGGNLVLATSEVGSYNDIVFGVGSTLSTAEVARFHGNVSTNGKLTISYTTPTSSSTTGALVVTGGVGIGGDLTVQGNINASYLNTVSSSQLSVTAPLVYLTGTPYPYNFDIGMYSHFIGGPANVYAHTGAVRSYSNGYWGFFSNVKQEPAGTVNWTDSGLIWDTIKVGAVTVANATAASSTTSGALTVAGGVGIAGAAYIGNTLTVPSIAHSGTNGTGDIGASGSTFGTVWATATSAKYADLAENYQGDAQYMPGQVVEFGGTREVTLGTADSTAVAGVVSTNPAHLMNGALTGQNVIAVALQGRVPCNVIGPVKKGQLMVSAGFGFAKPSANPQVGQVIGKALQDFDGAKGQIEVVVGRC